MKRFKINKNNTIKESWGLYLEGDTEDGKINRRPYCAKKKRGK